MNELKPEALPADAQALDPEQELEIDDELAGEEYEDEDEYDADEDDETIEYPPTYHSLMVMGLLGSVYGLSDDADAVDRALQPTLLDPIGYLIQRATAQSIGGHGQAAIASMKAHVDQFPQDDSAKVVLAVSQMMAGDPEWMSTVQNVLASSSDAEAREAATNLISYLRSRR